MTTLNSFYSMLTNLKCLIIIPKLTNKNKLFSTIIQEDILLRKELEDYANQNKKFKLHYTLDTVITQLIYIIRLTNFLFKIQPPTTGWKHFGGFVTLDMLK